MGGPGRGRTREGREDRTGGQGARTFNGCSQLRVGCMFEAFIAPAVWGRAGPGLSKPRTRAADQPHRDSVATSSVAGAASGVGRPHRHDPFPKRVFPQRFPYPVMFPLTVTGARGA